MDATAAAVVCAALGGGFELAGLGLVVKGIREDRRRARELLRPLPLEPMPERGSVQPLTESDLVPRQLASHGSAADEAHEARWVRRSIARAANLSILLRKSVDDELAAVRQELAERSAKSDEDLREALRYVLDGGVRDRALGAGLIGLGIVLSVAGSVLGSAS